MAGSVRNMAPNCSGDLSWWRQRVMRESQISLFRRVFLKEWSRGPPVVHRPPLVVRKGTQIKSQYLKFRSDLEYQIRNLLETSRITVINDFL